MSLPHPAPHINIRYTAGTLIRPEFEVGEDVWVYVPINDAGWICGTVEQNDQVRETGLYQVNILEPETVGTRTCLMGGARVLRRGTTKRAKTFMDDMPGRDDTVKAVNFLKAGAPHGHLEPTYRKGDTVWLYRKRTDMWVAATVVDTRYVTYTKLVYLQYGDSIVLV